MYQTDYQYIVYTKCSRAVGRETNNQCMLINLVGGVGNKWGTPEWQLLSVQCSLVPRPFLCGWGYSPLSCPAHTGRVWVTLPSLAPPTQEGSGLLSPLLSRPHRKGLGTKLCTVCVAICSTSRKFHLASIFT